MERKFAELDVNALLILWLAMGAEVLLVIQNKKETNCLDTHWGFSH